MSRSERRPGLGTHVGCSLVGGLVTLSFLVLVGAGTLFALTTGVEYLSTTVVVWLVLFWWVVWWLVAELLVSRVDGRLGLPSLRRLG